MFLSFYFILFFIYSITILLILADFESITKLTSKDLQAVIPWRCTLQHIWNLKFTESYYCGSGIFVTFLLEYTSYSSQYFLLLKQSHKIIFKITLDDEPKHFELALSNQGYQSVFTIFLNSFLASSLSNCTFRQSFDQVRKQIKCKSDNTHRFYSTECKTKTFSLS